MTRAALLLLAITGVLAGALAAQKPKKPRKPDRPHRSGLWGEIGGGLASMRIACSGCGDTVITKGGSASVNRIGGVISDRVLLGWEAALMVDETFGILGGDTTAVAELESVGVIVLWYPWKSHLFLKGGVSVAEGTFTVPTGVAQVDTIQGTGIGLTFGGGWDFPLTRKYALSLNAAAFINAIGDLVLPSGARVDDVIGTMYQLTLSFTFR